MRPEVEGMAERSKVRTGMAPRGALLSEIGQSFQLMGLMAAMLACYLGLGLLAVRVLA
jgi:hypothetical protein